MNYTNYKNYTNLLDMSNLYSKNCISNLYTPYIGYTNGNMFSNLYDGYKCYQPSMLVACSEKDELFLAMSQYDFAAHDLNLYLDNNPNDSEAIKVFNNYREIADKLTFDYEQKYGPLNLSSDTLNNNPWVWGTTSFPWEKGGI